MSGAHKVALALHGLHPKDQLWLLDQLPVAHRDTISTLVSEVADFTHRPTANVFEQVMRENSQQPKTNLATSASQQLEQCDTVSIFRVLQTEPDWVVATILHAQPIWGQALLALFDAERRAKITKLIPHVVATSATIESLASGRLAQMMMSQGETTSAYLDKLPTKTGQAQWMQWLKGIRKWLP